MQIILRFILGHIVKPGCRVWRNTFQFPRLRGRKESVAGNIFCSFYLVKPKMPAKDGDNFPIFGSEQLRLIYTLITNEPAKIGHVENSFIVYPWFWRFSGVRRGSIRSETSLPVRCVTTRVIPPRSTFLYFHLSWVSVTCFSFSGNCFSNSANSFSSITKTSSSKHLPVIPFRRFSASSSPIKYSKFSPVGV